ncbi:aryl-sulfate sulfotransferase [bacterium]|nr:aryl-sulfate sulfotransferase [bacterium]
MKRLVLILVLVLSAFYLEAGKYHAAVQYVFPLPDSKALSEETTVIVRFHPQYSVQVADLDGLIGVTGSQRESYQGDTFFSTDGRTLIFKPASRFQADETVHVKIETSRFTGSDFEFDFLVASGGSNVLQKTRPSQPANSVIMPMMTGASSDVRVINGVAVPDGFPTIETFVTGETAPGKIFYSTHMYNSGDTYIIAAKNDGTPYMYKRFDGASLTANFYQQCDGTFTVSYNQNNRWNLAILDDALNIVDEYEAGHGYDVDEHEFIVLENGHALMTVQKTITVDMSKVVSGGRENARVEGNMFQEFDRARNVIFEWRSWDHLKLEDAVGVGLTQLSIDYVHMNTICLDFDGHYILSNRHLSEITKIDRNTGEIIWRFGGRNNQFEFINDNLEFSWQHHVRPVPGNPNHYTVFDNGNLRTPNYSRAVEYSLDTLAMTAENVWQYRYSPDRACPWMGVVQILPNGNILVDGTAPNPPVLVREVTREGKTVFELKSYGHINYRAFKYDVDVNAKAPTLHIDNYGSILNLIFNKFGDEHVAYYKIWQKRAEETGFTVADTTGNTWYQIAFYDPAGGIKFSDHDFKISAVSDAGVESDFSETLRARIIYQIAGRNLIKNGWFISDANWELITMEPANAIIQILDESCRVNVSGESSFFSDIRLVQRDIPLIHGAEYTLQFDAAAQNKRYILVNLHRDDITQENYSKLDYIALTTEKQHFSVNFDMEDATDLSAMLVFECGGSESDVIIDNVSLAITKTAAIKSDEDPVPESMKLIGNYPNPFNHSTRIRYTIAEAGRVTLTIYDLLGREVDTLVDEIREPGTWSAVWNANTRSAGVYICRLTAGDFTETRKLVLQK